MGQKNIIPINEIMVQFSRSSGPGGQHVGKVSTKAEARWNVDDSTISDEAKEKIKHALGGKMTKSGDIIVVVQETRSQNQNMQLAVERLNTLVDSVFVEKRERIKSERTYASKQTRLKKKREHGEKKKVRQDKSYQNEY